MKTGIKVVGQINSVSILAGAISGGEENVKPLQFRNDQILIYKTKKAAIKALSEGYQYLHSDREDWESSLASYNRGVGMGYDAANATLIDMNE